MSTRDPEVPQWPLRYMDREDVLDIIHARPKGNPVEFRRQYEAQWPPPPCRVQADMPQPWAVTGESSKAVENVLREDYGAGKSDGSWFDIPDGRIKRVWDDLGLRGMKPGTLFVLGYPWTNSHRLARLVDRAALQGWRIEVLKDAASVEGEDKP